MKRLFSLLLLIIALAYLRAEKIEFDLKNFSLPEYKTQAANVIFDSYGNTQNSDSEETTKYKSDSSNLNFYLYPNYSFSSYTPAKFSSISIHTSHNFNYSNSTQNPTQADLSLPYKNTTGDSERYSSSNNLHTEYLSQRYLANRDFFWGYTGNLQFNSYYTDQTSDRTILDSDSTSSYQYQQDSNHQNTKLEILVEPNLVIGKGRLESVFPARKAIYILQALEDNKLLATAPNESQIIALANLINQINHKRFIDQRDAKIYALETILQFLAENNLLDQQTPRSSALVYDVWDSINTKSFFKLRFYYLDRNFSFPAKIDRDYGSKFSFLVGMPFQYYSLQEDTDSQRFTQYNTLSDDVTAVSSTHRNRDHNYDKIEKSLGSSWGIKHQYGNPFKLNWQFSTFNQLSYNYEDIYLNSDSVLREEEWRYDYIIDENLEETVLQDTLIDLSETIETKSDSYQHKITYTYLLAVGYHYNLRTAYYAYIRGIYQSIANNSTDLFSEQAQENVFISSFTIASKYWISQKLSIDGQINYQYYQEALNETDQSLESENISEHNVNFSLGFNYTFF
ncbi:MAG: hypothetical protein R6U84_01050 [Candidatus Cloacimonadales bacterium]